LKFEVVTVLATEVLCLSDLTATTLQLMAYWLLKSEPQDYSYARFRARGTRRLEWGQKSPCSQTSPHNATKDKALIYHTGKERQVVGLLKF
jgi:predicted RNA-binding protein with PUA-like domain